MEAAGFMVVIYEETGTQRTLIFRAIPDYGDEPKKEVDAVEEDASPDQVGEAAPTEDLLQRAGEVGSPSTWRDRTTTARCCSYR